MSAKKSGSGPQSLVGGEVSIGCLDREENEYTGKLLDLGELGATLEWEARGISTTLFVPMGSINYVAHRNRGDGDSDESQEPTA